ncbi:MAG TPA: zinc ribbon domain-containing protein [Tepidisphaeraceae bacterium]|jgi:putative FmdB family regulatory protein
MPTYDYKCEACGNTFEKFQSIKAAPIRKCPKCGKYRVRRLLGPGAGLIFKGSGFYITDYRSESYKSGAKAAEGPSSSGGGDKASTGDGKSASSTPASTGGKSESKPAAASKSSKSTASTDKK